MFLWWFGSYPLSGQAPTHVEVELGCDNEIDKFIIHWLNFQTRFEAFLSRKNKLITCVIMFVFFNPGVNYDSFLYLDPINVLTMGDDVSYM